MTVEEVKQEMLNFKDIKDIVVVYRGQSCTLKGYDDEVVGNDNGAKSFLDVHFASPEIDNCYAPIRWFSEQISEIVSVPETKVQKKKG